MEEASPLVRALLVVFVVSGALTSAWMAARALCWIWRRIRRPWEE